MRCAQHPSVETNLRCGKCDRPICPRCAVPTPVGTRCPACARLSRLPIFQVSIRDHIKAAGVGLGVAVVLGVIWGVASSSLLGLASFAALPVGYGIGELVSQSVNRKQGVGLQAIAGTCMLISYLIAVTTGFYISLFSIMAAAAGGFIAVNRFR